MNGFTSSAGVDGSVLRGTRKGEIRAAPTPDGRHPAARIFMHAARVLWSGLDPSHFPKPRFSQIETELCRRLKLDF